MTRVQRILPIALGVLAAYELAIALLAFAALQTGLHAINHWVDVNDASSLGMGLFDATTLTALFVVVVVLWRAAATIPTKELNP
jgi:hypothetical protein